MSDFIVSEARKGEAANAGVRAFFERVAREGVDLYLSAIAIGELRQGVEKIRHRGDEVQAQQLGGMHAVRTRSVRPPLTADRSSPSDSGRTPARRRVLR